jgi:hypothetical protein
MRHRETTPDPYNSVGKFIMDECKKAKGTYKYFCKIKLPKTDERGEGCG